MRFRKIPMLPILLPPLTLLRSVSVLDSGKPMEKLGVVIAGHRLDASVTRQVGRMRVCVTLFGLVGALMTTPVATAAQALVGTVVEAETGAPVQGASVILLSRTGERLDWFLTNPAGRFNFQLPRPGTYLLRAERIGRASVQSEPIPVEGDVTAIYQLEAPVEAIMLEGVSVSSSRRCEVRAEQGVSTATVWEEARKALEATSRTSERGIYRYVIRRYERELDARGRNVLNEQSRIQSRTLARPFASLDVDNLLENGFVRVDRDGVGSSYYAPDADVLLSDVFLNTHCMRLTEGRDEAEGLLGLSFEPTEERDVTEISGVLWLDPENGELQWLDYGYEFLDVPNSDRLGGRVRFDGLPNGTWIVRDWYIRMPILEGVIEPGGRMRTRLWGIREEGGLVVSVSDLQGGLVLDSGAGIIEGVVLDSEGSNPVGDVVVLLDDSIQVATDEEGRFQFVDLVEGYYSVRVSDPAMATLGFSPEPMLLEVRPGDVASARLFHRSSEAALMEECGPDELSQTEGILVGFALLATGNPAPGAQISVRWVEVTDRLGGLSQTENSLTTQGLREDGFFILCGVPRDRRLDIVSVWNDVESRPERFDLPRRQRIGRKDIVIPPAR